MINIAPSVVGDLLTYIYLVMSAITWAQTIVPYIQTHSLNPPKQNKGSNLHIILPVVWKANSTMPSSWSDAAMWNTEKTFFQPDLMLAAWELTICAIHLTTMSLIVGDLYDMKQKKVNQYYVIGL